MNDDVNIDPAATVNQVIHEHPSTVAVFARHHIDSCCGGGLAVEEAARRHGVDLDALLTELARSAGVPA
jgi:regulator of cell morphogenesis and NO signaling